MKNRLRLVAALLVAAPLAGRAQEPQKLTIDTSGWLILNTIGSTGGLNAVDLPRWAVPGAAESAFGMGVRQSRVRMNLGIPSDGLLPNAQLKGLIEGDFMGGFAGGDSSLPLPRLRHAWVSATWADLSKLSVLVGQTWGVIEGPYFASSLSHLAMPRFGGAGFLFRRAPQVRVSQELGKDLAVGYQLAALAPMDRETAGVAGVGERSGMPDVEGRVAGLFRPAGPVKAEVGLSAHYGQEKFQLTGAPGAPNKTLDSVGYAVDAKLDVPYAQLVGGAFVGENLDVVYALGGVNKQTHRSASNAVLLDDVAAVDTRGFWGQAIVTPLKGLQLLAGGGMELPGRDDRLPTMAATDLYVYRNGQLSGGALLNLTSKWRVGLEATRYVTSALTAAGDPKRSVSTQVELSTLLAL